MQSLFSEQLFQKLARTIDVRLDIHLLSRRARQLSNLYKHAALAIRAIKASYGWAKKGWLLEAQLYLTDLTAGTRDLSIDFAHPHRLMWKTNFMAADAKIKPTPKRNPCTTVIA